MRESVATSRFPTDPDASKAVVLQRGSRDTRHWRPLISTYPEPAYKSNPNSSKTLETRPGEPRLEAIIKIANGLDMDAGRLVSGLPEPQQRAVS